MLTMVATNVHMSSDQEGLKFCQTYSVSGSSVLISFGSHDGPSGPRAPTPAIEGLGGHESRSNYSVAAQVEAPRPSFNQAGLDAVSRRNACHQEGPSASSSIPIVRAPAFLHDSISKVETDAWGHTMVVPSMWLAFDAKWVGQGVRPRVSTNRLGLGPGICRVVKEGASTNHVFIPTKMPS